jgi:hypothetical protein
VKCNRDAPLEADYPQAYADVVASRASVGQNSETASVDFDSFQVGERATDAGILADVIV